MNAALIPWSTARLFALASLTVAAAFLVLAPGATVAGPAPLVVNSSGDEPDSSSEDGICLTSENTCTLRAAIEQANVHGDTTFIEFNIPAEERVGSAGDLTRTIQPGSVLPAIMFPANIDGRTQPGYAPGFPAVHLDGSLLAEGMGLYVQTGDTTIAGLRISGFPDNPATPQFTYGAQIFSASNGVDNLFTDNVLGLDADGLATGTETGIWLNANSRVTVSNNVLSGNDQYGLYITGGSDIDVTGNLVGLNETGDEARPNGIYGIFPIGASNVTIGASGLGRAGEVGGNVISGNGIDGIHINGSPNAMVLGNYVGTDITGTQDVGNVHYGVFVRESPNVTIAGNLVSGNGSAQFDAGVFIFDPAPAVDGPLPAGATPGGSLTIADNLIGTNAACDAAIPNENGLVALDQPNNDRLFWDEVLIDGNTISGNQGVAPAAAAGTVTAAGSDMVAGDGIVWGALLPPGENGLTISNSDIGTDCSGNPLGNSGDGMILALEPAVNSVAAPGVAPAGGGPGLVEFFVRVLLTRLSNNGEDCIQGDVFEGGPPGRTAAQGDLGDILGLTAQWQEIEANNCGENGVEINQRVTSVLSYTNESRVQLEDIEANGNGEHGVRVGTQFTTGGHQPPVGATGVQANGNGADGINIERNIGTQVSGPTNAPVALEDVQASNNGGDGVEACREEEDNDDDDERDGCECDDDDECRGDCPESGPGGDCYCEGCSVEPTQIDPPFLDSVETSGNGEAGVSVLDYLRPENEEAKDDTPVVICRVSPAGPPLPVTAQRIVNLSSHDNDGPGVEIIQVAPTPDARIASQGATCSLPVSAGPITGGSSIFNNGGPAIDLAGDGPTTNDPLDADVGPNGLTNFPILESATGGSVTIAGTYDGAPNTDVILRFYSNGACENGGEGEFYIGAHEITTDGAGHAEFEAEFPGNTPGRFVAATATGPEGTSEFSPCIEGEGIGGISGDTDCDSDVDSVDGLNVLRDVAGFPPAACIEAGNVDCDADRDSIDALFILRDVAALPVNLPKGCPEIGG
jgi:CSLREA domain-containing protein